MIEIEVGDTIVEFPDGMPNAEIQAVLQKNFPPTKQAEEASSDRSFTQMFTGSDRMTEQIGALDEIGAAPELNEMSMRALKSSFGLLSTGDDSELRSILTKQYGKDVSFSADDRGNTLVSLPSGEYALNKPGMSGQDVVRGLFDMAAFTPAGGAKTLAGAVVKNAMTEGVLELGEAAVGGEFDGYDVAVAGGLGVAGKAVENVASSAYRGLRGSSTSDVVAEGAKRGIPVYTTDVVPPASAAGKVARGTAESVPFAGTGANRTAQQASRVQATEDLVDSYSGASYNEVVQSLRGRVDKVKKAAGSVLGSAGDKLEGMGVVSLNNLDEAIKRTSEILDSPTVLPSSAKAAKAQLEELVTTVRAGGMDYKTLSQLRSDFMKNIDSLTKAVDSQMTGRPAALMYDVSGALKKDLDGFAEAALSPVEFGKLQKASAVYAGEANKLKKTKIKNILDKGDLNPEQAAGMLLRGSPSEVKMLYNSLGSTGKSNARAAIIAKASQAASKHSAGLTPNSFLNEMQKLGVQTDTFFKGKEKQQLNGLLKLLEATRHAEEAVKLTPSAQTLFGVGTVGAATAGMGVVVPATLGVGVTGRVYESAPVRTALLRLASVPKGSDKFLRAVETAQKALNSALQAQKDE